MRLGRPVPGFVLSPSERTTLEQYARRPTTAQALALRARIVLRCVTGATHTAIAADLGVTIQTVGKWRKRFVTTRIAGLLDEPRPGAPRKITDAQIERAIATTLESTPPDRNSPTGAPPFTASSKNFSDSISQATRLTMIVAIRVDTAKLRNR